MVDTEKEQEIWKTYPEYDFVEVSNLGRIRTKDRTITDKNGRKRLVKGKVLKQQLNKNDYMRVHFSVNGKEINLSVHRSVATCFIPNPLSYPEVNHKDNDPTNNRWDNLEWCTPQYNTAYREKYGISAKEATKALRRPMIAIDLSSFKVLWFESQHEAERQLVVYHSNIIKVVKGKLNKTGGYWFTYADETAVEKVREKFGDEIAKKVEELIRKNY